MDGKAGNELLELGSSYKWSYNHYTYGLNG